MLVFRFATEAAMNVICFCGLLLMFLPQVTDRFPWKGRYYPLNDVYAPPLQLLGSYSVRIREEYQPYFEALLVNGPNHVTWC
jgi:hypothetical protein